MKAVEIFREKVVLSATELVEIVIWQVPTPVPPSDHDFKYRLVYVREGQRVVGYDNERGKGDHRHIHGQELPYTFSTIDRLLADFSADVSANREKSDG
ncbi:hypothetical protein ROTAS13_03875 [Roseomonas sp. TAS13]|uniref:toxin-antitoxin system TumE family protein n=1 Tax=Roseomonas sp. TAS13 TaxID=1926319 RepID=UPI00095CFCA6|nr:DUF6516 family protein [Roseomonas sp. TAS13]USQ70042.1 DUF6516 family protein [Roseomonas mucosa]GAV36188.1 hypothetical protein ROTAS13_03875 [Roseomonas sp. TAS13]